VFIRVRQASDKLRIQASFCDCGRHDDAVSVTANRYVNVKHVRLATKAQTKLKGGPYDQR
jgi:hypothetical protein